MYHPFTDIQLIIILQCPKSQKDSDEHPSILRSIEDERQAEASQVDQPL